MVQPLLATKLKNQILALNPTLDVKLRNVAVNGVKFGCTGFVTNMTTGSIVYVSTDHNHHTNTKALYRTARDSKDYTGGYNRFATYDDLAQGVVDLLGK